MIPQPLDVNTIKDFWDYFNIWATVFSAIGTVLAFGVALVVYRRQVRDNRRFQLAETSFSFVKFDRRPLRVVYEARNFSKGPVYDVFVRCIAWDSSDERAPTLLEVLVGSIYFYSTQRGGHVVSLQPGEARRYVFILPEELVDASTSAAIAFRDTAGRSWTRDGLGNVYKVRQPWNGTLRAMRSVYLGECARIVDRLEKTLKDRSRILYLALWLLLRIAKMILIGLGLIHWYL